MTNSSAYVIRTVTEHGSTSVIIALTLVDPAQCRVTAMTNGRHITSGASVPIGELVIWHVVSSARGVILSWTNSGMKTGVKTVYPGSDFGTTKLSSMTMRTNLTSSGTVLTPVRLSNLVSVLVTMWGTPA